MEGRLLILALVLQAGLASECTWPNGVAFGNCTDCLRQAEAGCVWCLEEHPDDSHKGLAKGCTSECTKASGQPGDHETHETIKETINEGQSQDNLKPKQIKLETRPTMKNNITFSAVKQNNPVDIYFLLDFTQSMKTVINSLKVIIKDIKEEVEKITNDYKFGLGGFWEKPTPPFDTYKKGAKADFENYVALTSDTLAVTEKLNTDLKENNKDSPEGGLDGLMQLLLCKETSDPIGWRNKVKGIIIFLTNAPSHIGGDGMLGGLWKPYEHKCNLPVNATTGNNYYNGLETDYPSVSALRYEIQRTNKQVLFGVSDKVLEFYKRLVKAIGTNHAIAEESDTDLLTVVKETYQKIASRMVIRPEFDPKFIKITQQLSSFDGAQVGKEQNGWFEIEVNPEICNQNNIRPNTKITLEIEGQANSAMEIDITAVCTCENCNKAKPPASPPTNDTICRENGDENAEMVCGACTCDTNKGHLCQCDLTNDLSNKDACMDGGLECSNHGRCECEVCKCDPGYVGELCECDNTARHCQDRHGRTTGTAHCSGEKEVTCDCFPGFENPPGKTDCSCPTDKKHQDCKKDPTSEEICSGNGACECGVCECNDNFAGEWCQKDKRLSRDEREEQTCKALSPCVLEKASASLEINSLSGFKESKKAKFSEDCEKLKKSLTVRGVDLEVYNLQGNVTSNDTQSDVDDECRQKTPCEIYLNEEHVDLQEEPCFIKFCHNINSDGINDDDFGTVQIEAHYNTTITCLTELPSALIVGSAAGAGLLLFLIGFLTFCIMINIRDRREYRRFKAAEKEMDEQGKMKNNRAFRSSVRKSIRKSLMPKVTFAATETST